MPQSKTFEREVSGKMKKTWVRLPQEKWPVSKDFSGYEIPTEELISKDIVVFASSIDNLINVYDIERFIGKSYKFLVNVTARQMNSIIKRSLREVSNPHTCGSIIAAEKFCIQVSMNFTKPDFVAGKFRSLRA